MDSSTNATGSTTYAAPSPSQYFIIDSTLPNHCIADRSLFASYTPFHQVYKTSLGTNLVVEGLGEVVIQIFHQDKPHVYRVEGCWHTPSIPQHHFSILRAAVRSGRQIIIDSRSSRINLSSKERKPTEPEYISLEEEAGRLVLRFNPVRRSSQTPSISGAQQVAQQVNEIDPPSYSSAQLTNKSRASFVGTAYYLNSS